MAKSQNGWPALPSDSNKLYTWIIPAKNGEFKLRLRNGSGGFNLAHFALWYSEVIEDVTQGKILDDWGYADRLIRGSSTNLSNHASGTAMDLNALLHPLGLVKTGIFSKKSRVDAIHKHLRYVHNTVRWGGDYHGRKDEMHFEINVNITMAEIEAKRLLKTPRGKRLIKANPTQKAVIFS